MKNHPYNFKRNSSYFFEGKELQDEYSWIEMPGPELTTWVNRQNFYTSNWFEDHGKERLKARIAWLANKPRENVYSDIKSMHNQLYAIRVSPDGKTSAVRMDQNFNTIDVLIDGEEVNSQFSVYSILPSPGNTDIIAFQVFRLGVSRPSVLVKNMKTGEDIVILEGVFSFKWALDGSKLYFAETATDQNNTCNTVKSFDLATKQSQTLYTENEEVVYIFLDVAPNGNLFIHSNITYDDVKLVYVDVETAEITPVNTGCFSNTHYIGSIAGTHYFLTDYLAFKSRIIKLTDDMKFSHAVEVVPQQEAILEGACIAKDKIFLIYLHDASNEILVCDPSGENFQKVELPDEIGSIAITPETPVTYQPDSDSIYFSFQSFTCPPVILRYDAGKNVIETALGNKRTASTENIIVKKEYIPSRDHTKLLAFLVYDDQRMLDGNNPVLMYAYGGFGDFTKPWYTNPYMGLDIVDWINQGGIYVHCIVRGGGEFGSKWHEEGCRSHKKNAVYDFIDIAEWLIQKGITNPDRLVINGGSHGALLTTAAAIMRPDLFKAVVAPLPVTDLIKFSLDERGSMYITELGDPRKPDMFEYMLSYSPYHNIQDQENYPAIYTKVGVLDNNVPPYHGEKFIAKMQDKASGNHPYLLRVLENSGHDLGMGDDYFRTCAEMQIFAELMALNIESASS